MIMFDIARRTAPLIAAAVVLCSAIVLPADGQDASSSAASLASASSSASTSTTSAGDADVLATGKHVWNDAACYNCHGQNGQGGHSADFPPGPNLRTSGLDPDTMLQIVECGLPGTKMPSWLKGAYSETACYGNPLGPAPADVMTSAAYSDADLKALVAYVQVNFMKQPMPSFATAAQ
jgi:mono/diheme cytochrome c family protein